MKRGRHTQTRRKGERKRGRKERGGEKERRTGREGEREKGIEKGMIGTKREKI